MTKIRIMRGLALSLGLFSPLGWRIPASGAPPEGGSKTFIVPQDLYRFDSPQALVLSPTNDALASFFRVWIDENRDERQALWISEGDADHVRPLEEHTPDARGPVFSPNGEWIAFRSTRERGAGPRTIARLPGASDPATDIWLIPARGGRAIPLAPIDRPYEHVFGDAAYARLAFSPDGKRLAFVADAWRPPVDSNGPSEKTWDHGEGYTGYGPAQIWIADLRFEGDAVASSRVQRLTQDDAWYGDPQWSPDGRALVVHANKSPRAESARFSVNSKNFDLWEIDVATRSQRPLTNGPGADMSPRFSPDGSRLAYLSCPRKGPHTDVFNLAWLDPRSETPVETIVFDHFSRQGYDPADPYPQFPLPDEAWDGPDKIIYQGANGVDTTAMRVDLATGTRAAVPPVTEGLGGNPDSNTPAAGQYERSAARRKRLTPPTDEFLKERALGETRVVTWTNEGLNLEGVLTTPPPGVASSPYKLLVTPHGGPHSRSMRTFNFTAEVFAAAGYAVFQPNFRGSAGYDRAMIDADRGDFGGGDARDILSGIEFLIQEGIADRSRQFVYGVSYGGFMTTWLVGQTRQFRAAVAQNAVTDLHAMWNLSDIPSWTEWEFSGKPWEVAEAMRAHSPLSFAHQVTTPTLVLHSRDDRRCPLPMGETFSRALESRGVPTGLVIYPDEGHGIKQPRNRVDVLTRTLDWFAKHGGE